MAGADGAISVLRPPFPAADRTTASTIDAAGGVLNSDFGTNSLLFAALAGAPASVLVNNQGVFGRQAAGGTSIDVASDQLLGRDGTGNLSGQSLQGIHNILGIVKARKNSDQTKTNDTTLADDSDLVLALDANATYDIRFMIRMVSFAVPDYKFAFTVPAGARIDLGVHVGYSTFTNHQAWVYTTSGAAIVVAMFNNNNSFLMGAGSVEMGGTAGNLAYQWAQNVSDASATTTQEGGVIIASRMP